MAMTFDSVRGVLAKQISEYDSKIEASEASTKKMKGERRKLKKAYQSIGGGEAWPAPTAALVRPMVRELLEDNGELAEEEVYDLVRGKLGEQGVSAQGLALRVREALAIAEVVETPSGAYRLKVTQSPADHRQQIAGDPRPGTSPKPRSPESILRTVASR